MNDPSAASDFSSRLREVRFGVVLCLATVLFGFGMGGVFGAAEDPLKQSLKDRAQAVRETHYAGDEAKMKAVVDKSWVYFQRAHLHGGAIGTAGLAAIFVLAALRRPRLRVREVIAAAIGAGGLGYAVFWLMAGLRAPSLGSTGAAKESLAWLAFPSSGLLLLGLAAVLALAVRDWFFPAAATTSS